jgi:adenylylsulfate kinase
MKYEHPSPGFLLWLTGLPSSGKSTLASELQKLLWRRGVHTQVLDSDKLRRWLTPTPSYSQDERDWFYDAIVQIAGLLTDNGVNVLIAATGRRRAYRRAARDRVDRCAVIYLCCPKQVCKVRDTKGLWEKAARGEISNLPGAGAPYDEPVNPEVEVDTNVLSSEQTAQHVLCVLDRIDFFNQPQI